ncbi:hypothetical protein [Maioricimonas sp. JC845]|uniref:hypothetical protein n=1 Tax=Maioricimonas sp. JC845 TaxID=3232138 RepID=UPI003457A18F
MQRQAAATDDSAATCRPGRWSRCRLATLAVCLLLPAVASANPFYASPYYADPHYVHPIARPVPPPPVIYMAPARPVAPLLPRTAIVEGPLLQPGESVVPSLPERRGNLQIVVSKERIDPLVERTVNDAGPVRDFILGANVFGEQTTNTEVRLIFLPCPDAALFQIELTGRTNNRTVGVTPQAAIHSVGEHDFCISKKIRFDGRQFSTWSPSASVLPRQQNLYAQTPLGGIPLVGPVASNFALSEANRRTPIARNIIALKVTDQAAPRFNEEVDQKLAEANRGLNELVIPRLQEYALLPEAYAQTTSDELRVTLRLGNVAATPPPASSTSPSARIHVRLHQSFLNQIFARLPLAGAEVTDAEINQALSGALGLFGGSGGAGDDGTDRGGTGGEAAPALATLKLDDARPLRVEFGEGRFSLILRSAFQPLIGPRIDTQEISIPYTVEPGSDSVRLSPQAISITPADPGAGGLNAITEALLRQQVESRVPEITLPRVVDLPIPDLPDRSLRLVDLQLRGGWLVLSYE